MEWQMLSPRKAVKEMVKDCIFSKTILCEFLEGSLEGILF